MSNRLRDVLTVLFTGGLAIFVVPFISDFVYYSVFGKSIDYGGELGFAGVAYLFLNIIVFIVSLLVWEIVRKRVSQNTGIFLLPLIYLILNITATLFFIK